MTMTFLAVAAVFLIGVVVVRSAIQPNQSGAATLAAFGLRPGSRFQMQGKTFIVHGGPVPLAAEQDSAAASTRTDSGTLPEGPESSGPGKGRANISSDGDINLVY
jgi:hypothetical protein